MLTNIDRLLCHYVIVGLLKIIQVIIIFFDNDAVLDLLPPLQPPLPIKLPLLFLDSALGGADFFFLGHLGVCLLVLNRGLSVALARQLLLHLGLDAA